jgi:nucleotide-binding universal stress UspA family protein
MLSGVIDSREAFRRSGPEKADGPSLVIVGVDGSDSAWRAFAWALGHARRSHCPVLAIYVSGPVFMDALMPALPLDESVARARAELAEEIGDQIIRMATELRVDVRFEHHDGDPARVLLSAAEKHGADMLVLGASMQGVHRIAGSLPGRLVRCRRLPVVVIP